MDVLSDFYCITLKNIVPDVVNENPHSPSLCIMEIVFFLLFFFYKHLFPRKSCVRSPF